MASSYPERVAGTMEVRRTVSTYTYRVRYIIYRFYIRYRVLMYSIYLCIYVYVYIGVARVGPIFKDQLKRPVHSHMFGIDARIFMTLQHQIPLRLSHTMHQTLVVQHCLEQS